MTRQSYEQNSLEFKLYRVIRVRSQESTLYVATDGNMYLETSLSNSRKRWIFSSKTASYYYNWQGQESHSKNNLHYGEKRLKDSCLVHLELSHKFLRILLSLFHSWMVFWCLPSFYFLSTAVCPSWFWSKTLLTILIVIGCTSKHCILYSTTKNASILCNILAFHQPYL